MEQAKPTIDYAGPSHTTEWRRSRRLRWEATKLLIMTTVLAAGTSGSIAYGVVLGAGGIRSDHNPIYLGVLLGILTAIFALAAAMRYLESRSGD